MRHKPKPRPTARLEIFDPPRTAEEDEIAFAHGRAVMNREVGAIHAHASLKTLAVSQRWLSPNQVKAKLGTDKERSRRSTGRHVTRTWS